MLCDLGMYSIFGHFRRWEIELINSSARVNQAMKRIKHHVYCIYTIIDSSIYFKYS
jgi:hypothetical protein